MSEDRRPIEEPEGAEPLEEVGPTESESRVTSAEVRTEQMTIEGVAESEFRPADEIAEAFPIEEIPMVAHPVDGLPVPANERSGLATAPPFTHEHVTCVEDDREFVEVFEEERFDFCLRNDVDDRLKKMVRFRSQYDDKGREVERQRFPSALVERMFGQRVMNDPTSGLVLVRPIRERCVHYKRQVFSNDEVTDPTAYGHKIIFRNCTMRRSVGGAFMSVRDEAVYACDYRHPPDPASVEEHMDAHDRRKLRSGDHLKMIGLFGVTAEPETYQPVGPVREAGALDVASETEKKGETVP